MPLPTHGRAPGLLFTRKTPAHVQLRVAGRAEEFTILAKVLASADLLISQNFGAIHTSEAR